MSDEWRVEVDAVLKKTLLQADQKAVFQLPDMQRLAVIKAIGPVIDKYVNKREAV